MVVFTLNKKCADYAAGIHTGEVWRLHMRGFFMPAATHHYEVFIEAAMRAQHSFEIRPVALCNKSQSGNTVEAHAAEQLEINRPAAVILQNEVEVIPEVEISLERMLTVERASAHMINF